jgi:flavin-dependent dehydrogenase
MSRYAILQAPLRMTLLGSAIPLKNTRRTFERDHVLLVGDAAGFAESFYGEGIYFALKSAAVAADALGEAFDRPSARAYSALIEARIQPDLTYAELNARLFYPVQRLAFARMAKNAHVSSYFAELIAGHVRPRECFYKTLLTSPYWLWSRQLEPVAESL